MVVRDAQVYSEPAGYWASFGDGEVSQGKELTCLFFFFFFFFFCSKKYTIDHGLE